MEGVETIWRMIAEFLIELQTIAKMVYYKYTSEGGLTNLKEVGARAGRHRAWRAAGTYQGLCHFRKSSFDSR